MGHHFKYVVSLEFDLILPQPFHQTVLLVRVSKEKKSEKINIVKGGGEVPESPPNFQQRTNV